MNARLLFLLLGMAAATAWAVTEPGAGASVSTETSRGQKESSSSSIERDKALEQKRSRSTERKLGTEKKHDAGRSREITVEQNVSVWVMQALASHGRPDVQACVTKVSTFLGIEGSDIEAAFGTARQRHATACAFAIYDLAREIVARIKLPSLPAPDSAQARKLVDLGDERVNRAFAWAEEQAAQRIVVNLTMGGTSWRCGNYMFKAETGSVAILANGRPFWDAEHVGGKVISYKVAVSDTSTLSTTDTASASDTESTEASMKRAKAGKIEGSGETSRTSKSGLTAGK